MDEPHAPDGRHDDTHDENGRALRHAALKSSHTALVLQQRASQELQQAKLALEVQAAQLEQSLSLLQATLEATPEGIMVCDLLGKVLVCNQRYGAIFGYSKEVLARRSRAEFLAVGAPLFKDSERFIERLTALSEDPTKPSMATFEMEDGRVFERWAMPQVIDGDCVGMVISWRDITASHQAAALRAAKEAADVANRAKSAFLSRVSHELRTPLNAVLGFSQLLEYDPDIAANAKHRTKVEHIRTAGQHLLAMVDDILDITRIEAGNLRLRLEPVRLDSLVAECIMLNEPLAASRGVKLRLAHGADRLSIRADPTRLRQVLVNLLSNAIKYNRLGGDVQVALGTDGAEVTLRVQDTGLGLSEHQQQSLFEPFNRLGAEKTTAQGTGLGLVITKQLVQSMNGAIEVTSEAGVGSTFTLRFSPLNDRGNDPVAPDAASDADNHADTED